MGVLHVGPRKCRQQPLKALFPAPEAAAKASRRAGRKLSSLAPLAGHRGTHARAPINLKGIASAATAAACISLYTLGEGEEGAGGRRAVRAWYSSSSTRRLLARLVLVHFHFSLSCLACSSRQAARTGKASNGIHYGSSNKSVYMLLPGVSLSPLTLTTCLRPFFFPLSPSFIPFRTSQGVHYGRPRQKTQAGTAGHGQAAGPPRCYILLYDSHTAPQRWQKATGISARCRRQCSRIPSKRNSAPCRSGASLSHSPTLFFVLLSSRLALRDVRTSARAYRRQHFTGRPPSSVCESRRFLCCVYTLSSVAGDACTLIA